ncbi:DUF2147 domain-containing protein [Flaviaesturariibacter flavus]|uniref:DUF2147 domain-containing protein n=1 Tax=Flaviaesturariibacter flavus TaxID=2502780 RepID=A0A4R1BBQ0_9BACT|nr:DUF2147 domain-containing protein [Flaviaesturariibacter flavus]TCJ14436.1 DUF2147 domain-containing protein [Flaviaesturariibacter flavus]
MKALLVSFAILTSAIAATAQDAAVGKWWTPKRDGQIEVFKATSGKYFGKLIWGKTPGKKDEKNPDPALRSRDLVGINLFTGFAYDADDKEWVDGKIYDPTSGKTYSCKLWLTDNNKVMNVRGYIGFSLLGRTEKFSRVE